MNDIVFRAEELLPTARNTEWTLSGTFEDAPAGKLSWTSVIKGQGDEEGTVITVASDASEAHSKSMAELLAESPRLMRELITRVKAAENARDDALEFIRNSGLGKKFEEWDRNDSPPLVDYPAGIERSQMRPPKGAQAP